MVWQHKQFVMDQKQRSIVEKLSKSAQLVFIISISFLAGCTNPPQQVTESPAPTTSPLPSPVISPSPALTPLTPTPGATVSPSPAGSLSSTTEKSSEVVTIENQVKDLVTKEANLAVQAVNCPANINEQSGNNYECQVQSDIGTFTVIVQPTGQAGKFRWSTKGLLLVSKLAPLIEKNFESSGNNQVSVDCGAVARTAKAGETFDCKVVDATGKSKTARVTVRDDEGNVYVTPL